MILDKIIYDINFSLHVISENIPVFPYFENFQRIMDNILHIKFIFLINSFLFIYAKIFMSKFTFQWTGA